jgi:hypothetical protein
MRHVFLTLTSLLSLTSAISAGQLASFTLQNGTVRQALFVIMKDDFIYIRTPRTDSTYRNTCFNKQLVTKVVFGDGARLDLSKSDSPEDVNDSLDAGIERLRLTSETIGQPSEFPTFDSGLVPFCERTAAQRSRYHPIFPAYHPLTLSIRFTSSLGVGAVVAAAGFVVGGLFSAYTDRSDDEEFLGGYGHFWYGAVIGSGIGWGVGCAGGMNMAYGVREENGSIVLSMLGSAMGMGIAVGVGVATNRGDRYVGCAIVLSPLLSFAGNELGRWLATKGHAVP